MDNSKYDQNQLTVKNEDYLNQLIDIQLKLKNYLLN